MDFVKYYENQHSIKNQTDAMKYEFARLLTFEDIEKILRLSRNQLSSLGFFYDKNNNLLRCSDCSFSCSNLNIDTFSELFTEHVEQAQKCKFRENQLKFLKAINVEKVKDNKQFREKPPRKYESLNERLGSFNDIDIEIDKMDLAENGFFLDTSITISANLRLIRCYYCGFECTIFKKTILTNNYETPFVDHENKSPNCLIIRKKYENSSQIDGFKHGNIFLCSKPTDTIDTIQYNVNGNTNFDILKSILNKSMNATCDRPFHPGYVTEQARLDSFREWPLNLAQQPIDMARSGFYYYGIKDMVKCFYCNGGLRNWDPIDEPITEHARWFPKCPYIRQLKGANFIEEVRERYKDMDNGFKDDDDTPQYYDVVNNDRDSKTTKKRSISPRTINSRMDLPSIQKIIKLGFTRSLVKQVIENKLAEDGDDFKSHLDLVKTCYKMKDNSKKMEQQFKEAFHFYISNISMDITYKQISNTFKSKFNIEPLQISKICDQNNPSFGTLFIRLKNEHLKKCNMIVADLNEKPFPGIKSNNKVIVKKVNEKDADDNKESRIENTDTSSQNKKLKIGENDLKFEPMDITNENLVEEVEKLKRERVCVVCCDRQKLIIFLPCAHLAACVECSVALVNCPICRKKVEATVRAYC